MIQIVYEQDITSSQNEPTSSSERQIYRVSSTLSNSSSKALSIAEELLSARPALRVGRLLSQSSCSDLNDGERDKKELPKSRLQNDPNLTADDCSSNQMDVSDDIDDYNDDAAGDDDAQNDDYYKYACGGWDSYCSDYSSQCVEEEKDDASSGSKPPAAPALKANICCTRCCCRAAV